MLSCLFWEQVFLLRIANIWEVSGVPVEFFVRVLGYIDSVMLLLDVLLHLLKRLLHLLIFWLFDFFLVLRLPLFAEMGKMQLELRSGVVFRHCLSFDALDVDDARQVLVLIGDWELDLAIVSFVDLAGKLKGRLFDGGLVWGLWLLSWDNFDYRRRDVTSLIAHQFLLGSFLSFLLANLVNSCLFLSFLYLLLVHGSNWAYATHFSLLFLINDLDK